MPKTKPKRPSTAKSRSSKRSAGKAKPKTKTKTKTSAKRTKPARAAKPSGVAVDPRVLAAIGLALEDEAQTSARSEQLAQPASPWVALGRVRAIRTK